jgi:glucose/mannose-6-phosphate isomerase
MNSFDLDDLIIYPKIDLSNMLAELVGLPDQLQRAWKMGFDHDLPENKNISSLVITGMGGSAIAAEILAAYVSEHCSIPIHVLREYQLPAWANGKKVLIVASSHSGNTEEVLSVIHQAVERNCSLMAITTGGKLSKFAQDNSFPVWKFTHAGQPRSAVGYSFGFLLAMCARLKLIPAQELVLESAINAMQKMIQSINIDVPVKNNPAKRMAGQLMNRWVTLVASDYLAPIARRYKTQINELAKVWAQFECLPEMDHNTLAGISGPDEILSKTFVLFLAGSFVHSQNRLRMKLTREELIRAGINTDVVEFKNENTMAEIWSGLVFGDFLAYYLAIAYQIDPTPIDSIQNLKKSMQ